MREFVSEVPTLKGHINEMITFLREKTRKFEHNYNPPRFDLDDCLPLDTEHSLIMYGVKYVED